MRCYFDKVIEFCAGSSETVQVTRPKQFMWVSLYLQCTENSSDKYRQNCPVSGQTSTVWTISLPWIFMERKSHLNAMTCAIAILNGALGVKLVHVRICSQVVCESFECNDLCNCHSEWSSRSKTSSCKDM